MINEKTCSICLKRDKIIVLKIDFSPVIHNDAIDCWCLISNINNQSCISVDELEILCKLAQASSKKKKHIQNSVKRRLITLCVVNYGCWAVFIGST